MTTGRSDGSAEGAVLLEDVPERWAVHGSEEVYRGSAPFGVRLDEISVPGNDVRFRRLVVEHPGAAECASLRRVINGGEALPASVARRFHEVLPDASLYQMYGPTETTVASAGLRWTPDFAPAAAAPIGRPVASRIGRLSRSRNSLSGSMPSA